MKLWSKEELEECLETAAVICRDIAYSNIIVSVEEGLISINTDSETGVIS